MNVGASSDSRAAKMGKDPVLQSKGEGPPFLAGRNRGPSLFLRLALRSPRQQALDRLRRAQASYQHGVDGIAHWHRNAVLRGELRDLARRAHAFCDVAEAGDDLV